MSKRIELTVSFPVGDDEAQDVIQKLSQRRNVYLSLFPSGLPNREIRLEGLSVEDPIEEAYAALLPNNFVTRDEDGGIIHLVRATDYAGVVASNCTRSSTTGIAW